MSYLKRLFLLPAKPEALRNDQKTAAEILALDHRAQAEHHLALAVMYEARVGRLKKDLSTV